MQLPRRRKFLWVFLLQTWRLVISRWLAVFAIKRMSDTKVKFTSPFGVAKYPHISSPDTKGKFADGKYKTKLILPIDDPGAVRFMAEIDAAVEKAHGAKGAQLYKPYEVDEEAGEVTFTLKTKYEPAIFDARNKQARGVHIGGGSVIRLMGSIVEYDKGVTCQCNQVQIRELNGFGTSGFDEDDGGYAYDPDDAAPTSGFGSGNDDGDNGGERNSALDV